MTEPRWKTALNWCAVIMFFTMPMTFFVRLIAIQNHWEVAEHWSEFRGLGRVYETVTALVFGLAGLRSVDRFIELKNGKQKEPEGKDRKIEKLQ